MVIKIEAYRSQNGLTQCYSFQRFGHMWVHFRQSGVVPAIVGAHRLSQPARRDIATPSKLQRLQSRRTGIKAQKKTASNNTGFSREDILLEIHNT
jgi:hypothetical protein